MGVELPNNNNGPDEIAKGLDGAKNQNDVLNTLDLLVGAVDGKSAKDTLDFLNKVNGREKDGVGADLSLGTDDKGNQFLEITSPYSQKPIRANITD